MLQAGVLGTMIDDPLFGLLRQASANTQVKESTMYPCLPYSSTSAETSVRYQVDSQRCFLNITHDTVQIVLDIATKLDVILEYSRARIREEKTSTERTTCKPVRLR